MRTLLLLIPLILVGCSSYRPAPDDIHPVDNERLLAYQQTLADGAQIVLNRDMGLMGGGCFIAFEVDRKLAARVGVGEQASFSVPAGRRIVGIAIDKSDDTLCGMGRLRREQLLTLEPGEVKYLRIISRNMGGYALIDDQP